MKAVHVVHIRIDYHASTRTLQAKTELAHCSMCITHTAHTKNLFRHCCLVTPQSKTLKEQLSKHLKAPAQVRETESV